MKNILFACFLMLCIGSTSGFSRPINNDDQLLKKTVNSKPLTVVNAFIDASTHMDAKLLHLVLSDNAKVGVCQGKKIGKYSKQQLVSFYKKTGKTDLNCESDYEIVSSSSTLTIVRVDLKFPLFVQRSYITIERGDEGLWEITQVNRFNENI
ncbi:hypothetical protein H9X96_01535 [Pedobacter sp. N36a]|uniref:hypothetical protein n=1 Tax=Pedobacter sp. N36a TaxID=2767996 RepID=UPI0016573AB7|nr:hypothetical protein [Pedobacter sp. N36a]MBC8984453.1 hypothetical protein [Pedobacter sp. N36a]